MFKIPAFFQKKKSLFIPFGEMSTSVGGPNTFMLNLKKYLDSNQFPYMSNYVEGSSIFFPIAYDLKTLDIIKKKGGKIIQRLDGIYYPSKHGPQYEDLNRQIKDIYQNYADYIVFQSEYSRQQCFEMFGEISKARYDIIINGVDEAVFYPSPNKVPVNQVFRFITTGNFRNKDMLEPVIQALEILNLTSHKEQPIDLQVAIELQVVGPITNPTLLPLLDRSFVKFVGQKSLLETADLLRSADAFIYSHLNPPCPNSVLEAIATGLPVVGYDSGSMKELLYFSKELLADVSSDTFQSYSDFSVQKLLSCVNLLILNHSKYRSLALSHCLNYNFKNCGDKYVTVFNKVLS